MARLHTTTSDVVDLFAKPSKKATQRLNKWLDTDGRPPIVDMVRNHVTRTPYLLHPSQVNAIAEATRHPLGDIKYADIKDCKTVEDYWSPLAYMYAFHYLMEQRGSLFTWDELLQALTTDPFLHEHLLAPAQATIASGIQAGQQHSADAFTWRLGNAYYSFLREMYVLTGLRYSGHDLHIHPLADVLFRADAWLGHTTLSLYVLNPRYRDNTRDGRKIPVADILSDSTIPWRHEAIAMEKRDIYGRAWFPDSRQVLAQITAITAPPPVFAAAA